jgi:hypothetical protein
MSNQAPSGTGFFLYLCILGVVFGVSGVSLGIIILVPTTSSWDAFSAFTRAVELTWALVLAIASIGYFKWGWSYRSVEAMQKSVQRGERIRNGKLQKKGIQPAT